MNRSRLLTIAAAAVAVGATTLATTGLASAATDPSVEYINSTGQLTSTTNIFDPTVAGWSVDGPTSDVTFGPGGATLSDTAPLVLAHPSGAGEASLSTLVDSAELVTTAGSAYFGLALTDSDANTYYVIATAPGEAGLASGATFGFYPESGNETTLTAGDDYSIADIQAGFTGGPAATQAATIAAYGVANIGGTPGPAGNGTVGAVEFNGLTTYFTPTPAPLTVSPTTTTVSTFTTTGVTVSGTGFFPGETVTTGYGTGATGDSLPTTFVADANGDVTGLLPGPSTATPGSYSLVLIGSTSNVLESGLVTVTADPTTPATPAAPVATPVRTAATFTG